MDVSVVDAQGAVRAERHNVYPATTECHKVLYDTAYDAAEMLGAFEPPPPKEPVTCPVALPPPVPPAPPCPRCPPTPPFKLPPFTLPSTSPRFFIGLGAVVGSGIVSKLGAGPLILLGFVPSQRLPQLHVEFEGSWTSQMVESTRWHAIPLVGSLCWVRDNVRFCGGVATTIVFSNQLPNHESRVFGANFRVGTELFNRGPFLIRADVFGRVALAQRTFGGTINMLDEASPVTGGVAVIGGWALD